MHPDKNRDQTPNEVREQQSRSAREVGDAARWMLATNFGTLMGSCDNCSELELDQDYLVFSLFSAPGIYTVNEDGDTKSRQEKR
jgi:hypothetical protein